MRKIYCTIITYFLFIIIGLGLGLFAASLCYVIGLGLCSLFGIHANEVLAVFSVDIGFISTIVFWVVESY